MILTLEEAKRYLRLDVDYTEEDADVEDLIAAAEMYLKKAGCTLIETDESAKLAVKMLTNHWYDNREPAGEGNKLSFGLSELIVQLKYCAEEDVT